jgi:hypothetical protein
VPRKLKRTVVAPSWRKARADMVTTLLCMVPPSVGSGWQSTTTSGRGAAPPSGYSTTASIAPAGPWSRSVGASGSAAASGAGKSGWLGLSVIHA